MPGALTSPRALAAWTVAVLAAAAPAHPASNGFNGNGGYHARHEVELGTEHVEVKTAGGVRKSTSFTQRYSSQVRGPLISPFFGTGSASFGFEEGENLALRVAGSDPARRTMRYSFSGRLLPPEFRRYVTLSPLLRRDENRAAWTGTGARHDYIDTTFGGTVGANVPGLPKVDLTYHKLERRNGLASYNHDIHTIWQRASYLLGPFRFKVNRKTEERIELLKTAPDTLYDTTDASADATFHRIGRMGLDNAFVRMYYQGNRHENGVRIANDRVIGRANLSSQSLETAGVSSFATLSQGFTMGLNGHRTARADSTVSLFSRSRMEGWSLRNRVEYRNVPSADSHNSVAERLILGSPRYAGFLEYEVQGEETYGWGGGDRRKQRRDHVRQKLSLYPYRVFDLYIRQAYNVTDRLGRSLRAASNSYGAGGNLRPLNRIAINVAYDRKEAVSGAGAARSEGDTVSAGIMASPVTGVYLYTSYLLNLTRAGGVVQSDSTSLSGECRIAPVRGLELAARVYETDRSAPLVGIDDDPVDASVSVSYLVGKTRVNGGWESRQLSSNHPYERTRLSLTRQF